MLKLPKKEWLTRFAGTPLESISEWVRYYYISPVDYSYNDGIIIKIDDVLGFVDLGDLDDWSYDSTYNRFIALYDIKTAVVRSIKMYAPPYECKSNREPIDINWDMVIYNDNNEIIIHDHQFGSDVDAFKLSLQDKQMIYLKA